MYGTKKYLQDRIFTAIWGSTYEWAVKLADAWHLCAINLSYRNEKAVGKIHRGKKGNEEKKFNSPSNGPGPGCKL
jgi:hypothetical protein